MIPLSVFIGGGLGALSRWGLGRLMGATALPWSTFIVNVVGCFALGLLMPLFLARPQWSDALKTGIATGFLGGLTTFSTFGVESARAWQQAPSLGLLNLALNLGVGLSAATVGLWLGGKYA